MNLFGLFRRPRRHSDDEPRAETAGQTVASAPPVVSPPAVAPTRPPSPPPASLGSDVEIPLQPILEKLPQDLRTRMTMRLEDLGDASISIATEQILPQLALGAVKITFGQLRGAAPELFRVAEEYDSLPIILPLGILLSRINPNLLPRHPQQKPLQAPPEIKGPFGPRAEGVTFTTEKMKAPPATTPPVRMVPPPEPPKVQTRTVAPPPPAFVRPVAVPVPAPHFSSIASTPPRETKMPPAQKPIPFTPPSAVANNAPVAAPAITAPAVISAPLAELSEKWPEALKEEIRQLNLTNARVALPVSLLEPALKRGRIVLSWPDLRALITPPPSGASQNNGTELALPLKVIVPLFLERRPAIRPPLRVSVDRSIPDLFFGFPVPQMEVPVAAPIAETPPAPAPPQLPRSQPGAQPLRTTIPLPQSAPPVQPAQPIRPAQMADTNFFAPGETLKSPEVDQSIYARSLSPDTQLKKRLATPKEIVERAMMVSGVVGAVVALPDGLKVAAQVPPELNADTVAAFLPQIFDRVGQSTRELRMGALNNLKFTVGNVPWKIFRVNAVYFAAFGRAGEHLPTAELAQLAAELDRKTK